MHSLCLDIKNQIRSRKRRCRYQSQTRKLSTTNTEVIRAKKVKTEVPSEAESNTDTSPAQSNRPPMKYSAHLLSKTKSMDTFQLRQISIIFFQLQLPYDRTVSCILLLILVHCLITVSLFPVVQGRINRRLQHYSCNLKGDSTE